MNLNTMPQNDCNILFMERQKAIISTNWECFSVTINEKENIFNIYYLENTLFPCFAEVKYIS